MGSSRKNWIDRALEGIDQQPEAWQAADALIALAQAPVKTAPAFHPLTFADRDGATVRVDAERFRIRYSSERFDPSLDTTVYSDEHGGNKANEAAAMRNDLYKRSREFGRETVRVAVLFSDRNDLPRQAIVEGSENAIRRTLFDRATLKAWEAAGVTEVPSWDLTPGQAIGAVRLVPIREAPVVLQMETERRGLDHEQAVDLAARRAAVRGSYGDALREAALATPF